MPVDAPLGTAARKRPEREAGTTDVWGEMEMHPFQGPDYTIKLINRFT